MKKIAFLLIIAFCLSCNKDDDSCESAVAQTTEAMAAFTNDNSTANCLKFKQALSHQKEVCGELSADLANTLANLSCDQ